MGLDFYRIKRLPPYVFAEVNAMKARARAAGEDIIDFGVENPDQPMPQHIVDKLCKWAQNPHARRYSASKRIPGLRKALVGYYQRRFNVDLDVEREIIVTLDSKEGLTNLAMAMTLPGDIVLVPNPSYPIHRLRLHHRRWGSICSVSASPDKAFLEAMDRAGRQSRLLPRGGGVLLQARGLLPLRYRLFGNLLRRQSAVLDP